MPVYYWKNLYCRCASCVQVKYCSFECAKVSWEKYHKWECGLLNLLHSVGKPCFPYYSFGVSLPFSLKFKVFLCCILSDWNSPPLPTSDTCQWTKFLVRYVSKNFTRKHSNRIRIARLPTVRATVANRC